VADKKVANSLLALSSAAVLAVYAAGYDRTKAAATRFTVQAEERRPAPSAPAAVSPRESARLPLPAPEQASPDRREAPVPNPAPVNVLRPRPALRPETKSSPADVTTPSVPVATPAIEPAAPMVVAPAEPSPAVPKPIGEGGPAAPKPQGEAGLAAKPVYKDGTYLGWGTSRHGDIQAQVVIEDGRIKAATIAQCLTRYSCNVISNLPPQVAQRQSPETDFVSGATQSTNAFYFAVVEALSKAK
jgi:uncharacterized protein with FMN-binding domain